MFYLSSFPVSSEFTDPRCFPPADAGAGAPPPDAGVDCSQTVQFSLALALVRSDGNAPGVIMADANGDGLVDFLWNFQTTQHLFDSVGRDGGILHTVPSQVQAVYYLNTGSGWVLNASLTSSLPATPFALDSELQGFDAFDVNGDGVADLVQTIDSSPQQVLIGNGSSWTLDPEYTASLQGLNLISLSGGTNKGLTPVDYNNDGFVDYVQARTDLPAVAYRNTGSGWVADDPVSSSLRAFGLALVDNNGVAQGYSLADINGDGKQDIFLASANGPSATFIANGVTGDLLSTATTGLGEVTTMTWGLSDHFSNVTNGLQTLPLVSPVVTQLRRFDGRLNTFTTSMIYQGGRV